MDISLWAALDEKATSYLASEKYKVEWEKSFCLKVLLSWLLVIGFQLLKVIIMVVENGKYNWGFCISYLKL